jgi:uncharacterized protein YjeT (DUF2065 family)
MSPLLTRKAKKEVVAWIGVGAKFSLVPEVDLPPHVAIKHIEEYVEYAADIVQIVPAVTLTMVSAIVLVPSNISPAWGAGVLVLAVLLIFALEGFVLSMSPERYLSLKKAGLSVVSMAGIAINVVGLVVFFLTVQEPAPEPCPTGGQAAGMSVEAPPPGAAKLRQEACR